jgi:hypothetical protein
MTSRKKRAEKARAARRSETNRRILVAAGFIAVFGSFLLLANYYLDVGRMSADEGFYAVASRNVMQGEIPYRDFAYTQMPLLPYINGAAMSLFGWEMDTQRAINVFWALVGIVAIVLTLRHRLESWEPALLAAFTVAASPYWCEFQAMGKTYGAAGMFLALATCAMLMRWPLYHRTALVALFGTLATGCRLSLAPVVAIYVIALIIEAKESRRRAIVLALSAAIGCLLLLPFFLLSPGNMIFMVYEYHTASVFMRRGVKLLVEWWRMGPAAIILLAAGFTAAAHLLRKRMWPEMALLLGSLVGIILPVLPKSAYGNYIQPVLLPAAAAGAIALWSTGIAQKKPVRHVIWLLPLLVLLHPLPRTFDRLPDNGEKVAAIAAYAGDALLFRSDRDKPRTSGAIMSLASHLEAEVPQGPILTPVPIVATEAGREIMPGTDMGMFTVMASGEEERAARLNLVTIDGLAGMLDRREPAAVVLRSGTSPWNFMWQTPSLRRHPREHYNRFLRALRANYREAHRAGPYTLLVRN